MAEENYTISQLELEEKIKEKFKDLDEKFSSQLSADSESVETDLNALLEKIQELTNKIEGGW